jgi:hypothetical protein
MNHVNSSFLYTVYPGSASRHRTLFGFIPGVDNASGRGYPIRQIRRASNKIERIFTVEVAVNRTQVRKRRRLRKQLKGQAMAGVIGVQQIPAGLRQTRRAQAFINCCQKYFKMPDRARTA